MFKTSTLMPFPVANYFSEHRIAVYTCIIGAYDKLIQPKLKPNNIDYYVITDQPHSPESMWRFLDVSHIKSKLSSLSAVEQNRWYKTHPHLLFQDYDYSVYLDGNITPVSDFTELINRIGPCAIATHRHYCRNCVYEESEAILRSNKDTVERVRQHVRFLQEQGMPKNYGLADCSVIARKHHDIACIGLMEQWWEEFLRNSRRDQLSFPYVLFKNGMSVYDVTTLGSNRVINDALDVTMHIQATRGM
ncbi:MAG: glycosyltransferase domain-containing protein [Parachlamydiaceae bacterium]